MIISHFGDYIFGLIVIIVDSIIMYIVFRHIDKREGDTKK